MRKSKPMKKRSILRKSESGQTLVFVAIMLLLIGLVVPVLLALIFTSQSSAQKSEQRMVTFYAADAGVEAAMRQLSEKAELVSFFDFQLPGKVNDSVVDVTMYKVSEDPVARTAEYNIISTADGFGNKTTIESRVGIKIANFFSNAITSMGDVIIGNGVTVNGDVQYNGDVEFGGQGASRGEINGTVSKPVVNAWPTTDELNTRYLNEVEGGPHTDYLDGTTIDVTGNNPGEATEIGPLHGEGSIAIEGDGKDKFAKLTGTIYVHGSLDIGIVPGQTFTLNMNGKTIFVDGNITAKDGVTLTGTGCIIGTQTVQFWPNCEIAPLDFLFVMSVEGELNFKPGGTFSGSLAGNVKVELQSGCTFDWHEAPLDLNFPSISVRVGSKLLTYNIIAKPITGALIITTISLPNGEVNVDYSATLIAIGGVPPYTWLMQSGALPGGLSLSPDGVISGTPTTAGGPTTGTFKVTDSAGSWVTTPLSITIIAAPSITTTSPLPSGEVTVPYSQTLAATGGTGTGYTWSIQGTPTLPAGLSLSSGGVISGTPTATFSPADITFKVTDSAGGYGT